MAYVPSYGDDDEEKKKAAQPGSEATPSAASGTAAGAATSQGALADKGYVGIGQYLDANKDQAQGLADRITAPIQQQVSEAQASQADYTQDWKEDYQKRVEDWSEAADTKQSNLNTQHQNQVNQAYYDWQRTPQNVAPTSTMGTSQYSSLKGEREAAYQDLVRNAPRAETGVAPTPSAYTPDTSLAQEAQAGFGALDTQAGRQAALQDQATGLYTPGQSGLDAAILGMSDIGQAGEKYGGVLEALRNPTAPRAQGPTGLGPRPVGRYETEQAARKEFEKRMQGEMI